jgi:transcriptional regulator with PAS, ATPase and Fis domain
LALFLSELTSRDATGISPEAAEKLLAYDWPGNVREVQNAMQRAAALTQYEHIVVERQSGRSPNPKLFLYTLFVNKGYVL